MTLALLADSKKQSVMAPALLADALREEAFLQSVSTPALLAKAKYDLFYDSTGQLWLPVPKPNPPFRVKNF